MIVLPANYVLINEQTLNADTASVTLSNIPQTGYTDLKLVTSTRSTTAAQATDLRFTLNGNGSSIYSLRGLYGYSGGAGSFSQTNGFGLIGQIPAASSTANTFESSELYIPNYLSSANKSYSIDNAWENNSSSNWQLNMFAGLFASTATISSIYLFPAAGSFVAGSSFSLYGIAALGTTPTVVPAASGGDVITNDGTYWIHQFYSSGTFIPNKALTCDYLVIAGGGGSGGEAGAGGGGGGYLTSVGTQGGGVSAGSPLSLTASTAYTVTVGAGGAGGSSTSGSGGGIGSNGGNSTFATITALGGGGGSGYAAAGVSRDGNAGGSGGGGGNGGSGQTGSGGAASSPTQGYAGGSGEYTFPNARVSGGGGGAGSVGGNGNMIAQTGGNGGSGITSSITGTAVGRAGGGGGASSVTQGTGTDGGGTNSPGTVNTGGGGSLNYTFAGGKPGGSGIVIVRYLMS